VAVLPVPPLVDVTFPLVLVFVPFLSTVIVTFTVQIPLTPMVPFENVIEEAPAVGAKVGVPQPLVLALGGLATYIFPGKESVNATPFSVVVVFTAGLMIMKVSTLEPPLVMLVGLKPLLMTGGAITVKVALAVLPVPPFVEVTALLVFCFTPPIVPFTTTVTEHVPLMGRVPPDRLMLPPPATAVSVPPQLFVVVRVVLLITPVG
jgi:hypothetical protein